MRRRLKEWALCQAIVVAAVCLAQLPAHAQQPCPPLPVCPPNPCIVPSMPGVVPSMPGAEGTIPPGLGGTGEGAGAGSTGAPSFGELASGAGGGSSAALDAAPGGYLDNAIPKTMFRLRYDDGLNMNQPDRATYFYGAWKELSFHAHPIVNNGVVTGVFIDPNAQGPVQSPGQLNYQEISSYFEYALNKRFSAFVDLPFRFVHYGSVQEDGVDRDNGKPDLEEQGEPRSSNNPNGLSDVQVGFKYALLADPDQYLTFQFRSYLPTGDPRTGMGTGHVSLEPAVLYYKQLGRVQLQGQFSDWIPIGGGPMEGNVLSYGVGLGYEVYRRGNLRVVPITEFVGWTVLDGYKSFFIPGANITPPPGVPMDVEDHGVTSAAGDTIINAKLGVRTYFCQGNDVYVGWGHALTGDRWYKDIFRVEYRLSF